MQYSLTHLPKVTRDELISIRDGIKMTIPETMYIILFGSYAKGNYVPYDQRIEFGVRTYYKSDYDIFVITSDDADHAVILSKLQALSTIHYKKEFDYSKTPTIQFLTDTESSFAEAINDGRYFYSDIYKEGILLYAKKELIFEEKKELSSTEKRNLALEYFNQRFERGNSFLRSANHDFNDNDFKMASFHLHQAVENYLLAIILTSSLYTPKEHNLSRLLEISSRYTDAATDVFPALTPDEKRLLQLLEDAYVDGRYNPDFDVRQSDIVELLKKINQLQAVTNQFCTARIDEYATNSDI